MLTRVQTTHKATLTHQFIVGETLTDAAPVTANVRRLDGTLIAGSPFATTHPSTGTYSFDLPASAQVDFYNVEWLGTLAGVAVTETDQVEIVGGFMCTLARMRSVHAGLKSTTTWSTADLEAARTRAEQEAERVAGHAFVPRFARYALDGNGKSVLAVPDIYLRAVRAVIINGTALDAPSVAALTAKASGVIYRPGYWPCGQANIIVEYEHGMAFTPGDVEDAFLTRLPSKLALGKSAIPDRAISYTIQEGGVYRLGVAGPRSTGIPETDAAYRGYAYDGPV
jgi:hypothetical protein